MVPPPNPTGNTRVAQITRCSMYPDTLTHYQVLEQVRDQIEYKSSYAEEYILDCIERPDDWLSGFEQSQLEYDGAILYPEPTINYEEIVNV
jgi:hypothetical protein